ncbi:DEAD/DEAH box helicase [Gallaecimonas kandeliae]|uniref:DEAD/DEAH box helicase n=1 Tax=Gallaecimonas kandeliae TaxID=3029055 RepID=UPI00264873E4|nr:DEAD/DEAH box helicase [Gallaecimonas kandeliae]WKE65231.1 DEAD/DEAH box helicase [Gallaecimonas kandeliae]
MQALDDLGFQTPSPIQASCIPLLLEGRDVLGIAQTGTGKTAAFGLPLLANVDTSLGLPQLLLLAPTRELAQQVAAALIDFGRYMPGLKVVTLYGGAPFGPQKMDLRRGAQVVVATPGRMIDHLDRGSLTLDSIKAVVLDEADEMLRMGFIEDVERILSETPAERQTALFSATLPPMIRNLVNKFMGDYQEVKVSAPAQTVDRITQKGLMVFEEHKPAVLTRVLEAEDFDAAIIFARTKDATTTLAEHLNQNGFKATAMNGDLGQREREAAVEALKDGRLDIVVATDVAARGLDVERIGLVVNYDIPREPDAYVHRIGRTGRAGRTGTAVLLYTPRERMLLSRIEKVTRQKVDVITLPDRDAVFERRVGKLKDNLAAAEREDRLALVARLGEELELSPAELAAALLAQLEQFQPLAVGADPKMPSERGPRDDRPRREFDRNDRRERFGDRERSGERRFERKGERFGERSGERRFERNDRAGADRAGDDKPRRERPSMDMVAYRLEVGRSHGATPRHIVGAIANEAKISSKYIGQIKIHDEHSVVMLPTGMPKDIESQFQRVYICSRPMKLRQLDA